MRSWNLCLIAFCIFFLAMSGKTLAKSASVLKEQVLTVSELLDHYHYWDQKTITMFGEVIGQPIFSQNQVCIHILDSQGNAIAVWINKQLLSQIKFYGKYRIQGDQINIKGIFQTICLQHPGDTDVHANQITVLKTGHTDPIEKPDWIRLYMGVCFMLVLLLIYFLLKKNNRKALWIFRTRDSPLYQKI